MLKLNHLDVKVREVQRLYSPSRGIINKANEDIPGNKGLDFNALTSIAKTSKGVLIAKVLYLMKQHQSVLLIALEHVQDM